MLWRDLKRAVHKQIPTNLNEVKPRCKKRLVQNVSTIVSETESQAENGVVLLFHLKMALHATSSKNTRLLDTIHKAVHKHCLINMI